MVIDRNPNIPKQKEAERKLAMSDDERKDSLLEKLRAESTSIVLLAYMYAKNFEETGADITERWTTMEQQNAVLQKVYNKGYEDGIDKGKELEREKNKRDNATNISVDEFIRQNTVQRTQRNVVQPTDVKYRRKSTKKRHKR